MSFDKNDVPRQFNLAYGTVLLINSAVCGGEPQENAVSGICVICFETTYPGILDGCSVTKYVYVGEFRSDLGVALEGNDIVG